MPLKTGMFFTLSDAKAVAILKSTFLLDFVGYELLAGVKVISSAIDIMRLLLRYEKGRHYAA